MPFKSEAQRAKFKQLVADGKMTRETFDKWQEETGDLQLPERAEKPKDTPFTKLRKSTKLKRRKPKLY
jgi:hypothetical protein